MTTLRKCTRCGEKRDDTCYAKHRKICRYCRAAEARAYRAAGNVVSDNAPDKFSAIFSSWFMSPRVN